MRAEIYLRRGKEQSLLRRHPWIFSGAIERVKSKGEISEGEIVDVFTREGDFIARGHYQIGSIAVRILAFGLGELPADFWQERIRAAYEVRCSLGLISTETENCQLKTENCNNTYRLVHGEGDFLPGLIVDVYADTAVIQAHSIGMHCHRPEIAEAIVQVVPQVDKVYYK